MVKNIYPLTPLQEGMLFHSLMRENETPYFEQMIFDIKGDFDIEIFRSSWNKIVERYDVFRTIFVHKKTPSPKQVVLKEGTIKLFYQDISTQKMQQAFIENFKHEDKQNYFNLEKQNPLRVNVFKKGENFYSVIVSFHHILMDGWSGGIVFEELFTIYNAQKNNQEYHLSGVKPYSVYIKWLQNQDKIKTKTFWKDYLEGYNQATLLPQTTQKNTQIEYKLEKYIFHIEAQTTKKLNLFIQQGELTLNIVMQTVFGILLAKANSTQDAVFGATVSGRVDEVAGIEKMVGLFINAIPVRVQFSNKDTLLLVLKQMMAESLSAKEHHYYSLADIQNSTPLKDKLINQLFVFENYPSSKIKHDNIGFEVENFDIYNQTNYDFDITIHPSDSIEVMFKYNTHVYDKKMILNLEKGFMQLINLIIDTPNMVVKDILLEGFVPMQKPTYEIFISSSFTIEPIEESMLLWAKKFDLNVEIFFSGYNQVIQDLLNPTSRIHATHGLNLLMIRFEDSLRFLNLKNQEAKIKAIEDIYQQITSIIQNIDFHTPIFFPIFKPAQSEIEEALVAIYVRFEEFLAHRKNLFVIDLRDLDALYQVDTIFDAQQDKIGHIPFSIDYYHAMGTFLLRQIYSFYKQHFKVIALDCDNTLWRGIVGEDGALGVKIESGYLELQKFIAKKEKEGFLIVLNSKNNEGDVWEVFNTNKEMILSKDKIVNAKINWQPKSSNLKEMAKELNLGLDSFIFIDDNPLECSEVITNAPEVLTLVLPKEANKFKLFLEHVWAFDKLQITQEDRTRTQMYIAQTQRDFIAQNLSLSEFLSSLQLKIYMNKMFDSQLERVSQLTKRTNQFNTTTLRRDENEIVALLGDENVVVWSVNVEDKFGDYGLVGVVISKKIGTLLYIDSFLMSCRVLGRGVENSILFGLKKYAIQNNLTTIEFPFYPTSKNFPALEFIQNSGFELFSEDTNGAIYRFDVNNLPTHDSFVAFYFDKDEDFYNQNTIVVNVMTNQEESIEKIQLKNQDDFEFDFLNTLSSQQLEKLKHKKFYLPLEFHKASDKHKLISQMPRKALLDFVPPTTPNEQTLASIYSQLLNIDKVGIEDCFFELGGHSLLATRLLSRVYQTFHVELSLKDIFDNPTIKRLVKIIEKKDAILAQTIIASPKQESYPLSSTQKRVWLIDKLGGGVAYNMPIVLKMGGNLDVKTLEKAFNTIIARHESLRTYFIEHENEPQQKIQEELHLKIDVIKTTLENGLLQIKNDAYIPFELSQLPLFRIKLFGVEDYFIFYFNIHHIISDGWSMGVITKELNQLYHDKKLNDLSFQYKDFTLWQNNFFNSQAIKNDKEYWKNKFQKEIETLVFETDFARQKHQTFHGESIKIDLSQFIKQIQDFNSKNQTTLFMFFTTIIKTLLARYTNQEDIILGFPILGRDKIELEEQIGFYANTLALRDTINLSNNFNTLIQEIKKTVLEAHQHQQYPFEKLVDDLKIKRDISRTPLFDFAISLNTTESYLEFEDVKIELFDFEFKISQFDMSFNFDAFSKNISLNLNYNKELFSHERMQRVVLHLENLIKNILENPLKELKNIDFLTHEEKYKEFRIAKEPKDSIVALFEKQVKISQDALAIIFHDKKISYNQLDEMTNRVANYLKEIHNIDPKERVAFLLPRSELSVIAILSILKVGATFLPLNIALPQEKINFILKDSDSKLMLDTQTLLEALEYSNNQKIVLKSDLDSSAYIIYTSGSTGEPKGVEISQKSLLNLIDWYIHDFEITNKSKVLLMIPTSFDASIKNILAPLFVGGEVIVSKEQFDPYELLALIEKTKVTLINCVPSAFRAILDTTKEYNQLQSLTHLAFGGESLELLLFKDLYKNSNIKIFNIYGPTEATDITTMYEVQKEDLDKNRISIGKAIPNVKTYILDKYQNLVPLHSVGELYIGGIGLAKGYASDTELTNKSFINHHEFGRIYKTGDLVKEGKNGELFFQSRDDEQIKIRGNRVEIKEVTHAILQYDLIDEIVVLFKENSLIAFIKSANILDVTKIREYLQSKLLPYMIPATFVQIEDIPLTHNGKIDKKALLEMKIEGKKSFDVVLTPLQKGVLSIIEEILQKELTLEDNFFEVGGDSLNGVKVIAKINEKYNKKLKLSYIFEHQYIDDFIKSIENQEENNSLYTIFNKDKKEVIFVFPSLLDIVDYKITPSKLAKLLPEYKIYGFDFIVEEDRCKQYASLVTSLEEEFIFFGYSSGGNIAFEVIEELKEKKPSKLILLDSWKIEKINSIEKNDFIEKFDTNFIQSHEKRIDTYIGMLNNMTNTKSIDVAILLLTSNSMNDANEKINQNWGGTNKFETYKGFGEHFEMLENKNMVQNCKLIIEMLK